MNAIVSIHDVSPVTLERVKSIIATCSDTITSNLILLIIPGHNWLPEQMQQLAYWQSRGCVLAGHGWMHHCEKISSIYHHIHSTIISRNTAEHLSLNTKQIQALLEKNHNWFSKAGLSTPDYYVPPAWAMGSINKNQLKSSPFRYFETTGGIYDSTKDQFYRLPLVGFEADTPRRKYLLTFWNKLNNHVATAKRPLRISIHPFDFDLLLSDQLKQCLFNITRCVDYHDLSGLIANN